MSSCDQLNRETALISVIMPVHNGKPTLGAALASLLQQTYTRWELLVVDDGSTDGSSEHLMRRAREDDRIHVFCTPENIGPSGARNEGLRRAAGDMIAYLDCDDEFYSNYLELVNHFRKKGDVLVFRYDVVEDTCPDKRIQTWDPTRCKDVLFDSNIAAPLGVAHRRDLGLQVGGFDEDLWALEDWDFWKRMARTGAEFVFPPFRSGIYHKRQFSRSRAPRLTAKQRDAFECRLRSGKALYGDVGSPGRAVGKILLWTSVFPFGADGDETSGLAEAAHALTRSGLTSHAFCPTKLAADEGVAFERVLLDAGTPFQVQDTTFGHHTARMIYARAGAIPVSMFQTRSTRQAEYGEGEAAAIIDYFEKFLLTYRPDALIASSPGPKPDLVFDLIFHVGKSIDIPTVLWLGYESAINVTVMQSVDYCVVTSDFLRRRYWEAIGLVCQTLPPAFDFERILRARRNPQQVVVILSRESNGETMFAAKIVERLGRTRPNITVVIAGRNSMGSTVVAEQPVPRQTGLLGPGRPLAADDVISNAKVVVVPSFGHGLFDRAVAQAMISGVPVIVSDRGALPEIVGLAGIVLDIPARYQPESTRGPTADDISPWVESITRLWDDDGTYSRVSAESTAHSQRWHPDRTTPVCAEFFRSLRPQPGPPLVPKWSDPSAAEMRLT